MLGDLATSVAKRSVPGSLLTDTDARLLLLSLHPFSAGNAETVSALIGNAYFNKAIYTGNRTIAGQPDVALLNSLVDSHIINQRNTNATAAINQAYSQAELQNPKAPDYFDNPVLWEAGRNQARGTRSPAQFVTESRAMFANGTAPCILRSLTATFADF